ncbi:MAG: T9SS type A sorting domain-containing protein [Bacteroidota bacterium]
MKKIITIFVTITISLSSFAQNWQWVKRANPSLRSNEIIGTSINNNGEVFACGYYVTSLNIGTGTDLSVNFPGDYQNFVAKYNSAGVAQWLRNIEPQGPNATAGMEVSSDTLGNCYVASGYGYISSGPGGNLGYASSYGGFHYLRKINSTGSDVWMQTPTFGSNSGCSFESMKTDGAGNTYITGPFQGTVTFGSITLTSVTYEDVFIAKYDPSGLVEYAIQATPYGHARGHSIDVDYAGNVVVVGEFQSDITFGTTTLTSNGGRDYFMVRLDPAGNVLWAKSGGSNYDDKLWGVAIDYPRIYVTGNFGANFTFGSLPLTTNGLQDIMVACTDMSGNELWALSNGGGSDRDLGYDITTDHNGGIYASGNYNGPATFGTTILTGADGAYIVKYDISGNQQWVKKVVGTSMSASGKSISANRNTEIVMAGTFCCFGSTLDFSSSSFSLNANGVPGNYGSGFYLAKLANCNMAVSAGSNVSISCSDTTLLTATGGTSYSWAPSTGLVTSNTASVQAHPLTTTTYTCTIGEPSGCSSSAMVTVTVTGGPTVSLTGTTSICQGESTQLIAGGSAISYSWLPTTGVNNPNIANPIITPTNTTTYTVTAIDTNGCAISEAVPITVNPTYSSSVSDSMCFGETYTFPDGTTSTIATIHTSHFNTVENCDSSIVTTLTINCIVGINDATYNKPFAIYPNPTSGQFIILLPTDNATITVTDILGQQILKTQTTQKATNLQIDNNGVYAVNVTTIQGTTTRKIIVNR